MAFRIPAPEGRGGSDRQPRLVLPDGTMLKKVYELHYLASGGMSTVYKALKGTTVFIIKEVDSRDGQGVVALTQEMTILQRLDHPGIVKVFELFEEDGFFYLVEEYIDGASLDRLISPDAEFIQERVTLGWALQLFDIFDYLHRQKPPIIYRDLKPQNIMKDRQGRIHLVDFGIARLQRDDNFSDTLKMGTTGTASPEHYGGRQTDARSDIYTLGASLHMLLARGRGSGRKLFHFEPVRSINLRVPASFEKALEKALALDPGDRFQTVDEMRQATLNALKELPPLPGEEKPAPEVAESFVSESGLLFTMETPEEKKARLEKEQLSKRMITAGIILICLLMLALCAPLIMGGKSRKAARQGSPASQDPLPLSMRGNPDAVPPPSSTPLPGQGSPSAPPEPAAPTPFFIVISDPSQEGTKKSPVAGPILPSQNSYPRGTGMPQRPRIKPSNTPDEPTLMIPPPQFKDIEWFLLNKKQLLARLLHIDEGSISPPRGEKKEGRYAYTDGSGMYYEITLPEGYLELGHKERSTQFANLDKAEGKGSLRLIGISFVTLKMFQPEVSRDEGFQKYINALIKLGAKIERHYKVKDATKTGYVVEYRFAPRVFGGQMYFKETVYPKSDFNNVYTITACCAPESTSKYLGEFERFAATFYAEELYDGHYGW